jgi:hypothetical protein
MPGLQDRTRLRTRRAQDIHARVAASREGEGLARHATLGPPTLPCAGGGSTAFSGDRAQAWRKAVDAPKAPQRGAAGASAPDAKHQYSFEAWQPLAVVCARVIGELGRRRDFLPQIPGRLAAACTGGESTAFSGDRAQRARRKAVDAPEVLDPWTGGASAPLPKHHHSFASWQSLAAYCGRVLRELGGRPRLPDETPPRVGSTPKSRRSR